ncbi:hypothetical protein ACFL5K_05005 [Gemmatimonadota bacterium]
MQKSPGNYSPPLSLAIIKAVPLRSLRIICSMRRFNDLGKRFDLLGPGRGGRNQATE